VARRRAGRRRPGGSAARSWGRRRSRRAARRSRTSCPWRPGRRRSGCQPWSRPLHSGTDDDDAALRAGDRAGNEQQAPLDVDGVDREVLGGLALVAHATGHPLATEHAAGRRGPADRAGLAVVAVRTVGGADAGEAVTLHDARGALALRRADDVDDGAGLERVGAQLLTDGVLVGLGGADLSDEAARRRAGLLEVALEGLGDLAGVDLAEGQLDGAVAVGLLRSEER